MAGEYLTPTPYANPLTGLSNDIIQGLLGYMKDKQRTQQMQGLAGLLESTGIPKTVERAAYADSPKALLDALTNVNRANVPLLKPETADAIMNIAPLVGPAARAAESGAMAAGRAGERYAEKVVPQIMERGGLPAQLLGDLSQGSIRPIQAWHGSGKLFPEFDVTRTPEQGYAYTRGSYAAAAKREAQDKYMPRDMAYEEKVLDLYKKAENAQDYESMEVLESALMHQTPNELRDMYVASGDYDKNFAKKAAGLIDKIETFPKESYLYKLDVKDEALPKMLQFDNPISQQSPEVRAFAKELGLEDTDLGGDIVGKLIANNVEGLDIQKTMRSKGIPGLIYNSPDVQGSVNYVTYDPDLYKILEINDKPYEQWFPKTNLLETAEPSPVSSLQDIQNKFKDVALDVYENKGTINLSRIVVPKEMRSTGIGSSVMNDLVKYADSTGQKIALTPSDSFGGNVKRLKDFYKEFGFVENKGKNKDFSTMESMIRQPSVIDEKKLRSNLLD